ncbi:MAG: DUF1932 domain-containing protein [Geminicoccaceae bacterium]
MEEIAKTFGSAGLSSEIFQGIAGIYRLVADHPIAATSPKRLATIRQVLPGSRVTSLWHRGIIRRIPSCISGQEIELARCWVLFSSEYMKLFYRS